jgi:hypothetical protein
VCRPWKREITLPADNVRCDAPREIARHPRFTRANDGESRGEVYNNPPHCVWMTWLLAGLHFA